MSNCTNIWNGNKNILLKFWYLFYKEKIFFIFIARVQCIQYVQFENDRYHMIVNISDNGIKSKGLGVWQAGLDKIIRHWAGFKSSTDRQNVTLCLTFYLFMLDVYLSVLDVVPVRAWCFICPCLMFYLSMLDILSVRAWYLVCLCLIFFISTCLIFLSALVWYFCLSLFIMWYLKLIFLWFF